MKIKVLQLIDSKFTNDDGEIIEYAKVVVLDNENQNGSEYKGHSVNRYNAVKGLINTVNAKDLPGDFEAEYVPDSRGRIRITALKHLSNQG